ncbi:hypothetical protein DWZ40_05290 [Clostridium sp. AF32-12BH]|nr:hypothetical protein DWZ40_05290 [Clostridium sp. AF32-12BH]
MEFTKADKEKNMERKKNKAVSFFAVCMAILVVCSVLIWGFQSGWGNVRIKRLNLTSQDGTTVSSLIYIPKNATNDTPAPLAVIYHGRSNHAHSNDTWSMELARRGYVVLSPDLQGGGESDPPVDRSIQAISVAEYANSLPYVEKNAINLIGYSAGTHTVLQTYHAMPERVKSICEVFGPFMMQMAGGIDDVDTNFCLIKSDADQYDYFFVGDPQACTEYVTKAAGLPEVVSGEDYDRNGKLFRYSEISGTLHQTGNISGETIEAILSFESAVNEEPISRPSTDTAWFPQQIFSGIACVTMMFLLAALVNLLMQNPFFASAANPVPVKAPRSGAKAWILDILFAVIIPMIIFVPVSAYVMVWTGAGTVWSKFLTSANLNGIMGWLLVLAAIGIVRMLLTASKRKKEGKPMHLSEFALGGADESKIDWTKPAKGFLMGLICVTFVFVWLGLLEGFLGINYQVWKLSTYLKICPMRILRAIPYVLIIFFVMFTGNMSHRVLPSTGNAKKDMWIAVAVNTVLTALALFLLLLIQYGGSMLLGTGQTLIPQIDVYGTGRNTSCGALDFAFGYCYMMGGTTGVVTYLYRKFGNIWVGVIPAAMFAGMVTLSGFTLIG